MCLDMFLEILRTLEGLAAELALVRLQRHMDPDVGGDVVALDGGGPALTPGAGEVEVVGRLAADMALTDVFLFWSVRWVREGEQRARRITHIEGFGRVAALAASLPLTLQIFTGRVDTGRRLVLNQRLLELTLLLNDILRSRWVGGRSLVRHFCWSTLMPRTSAGLEPRYQRRVLGE